MKRLWWIPIESVELRYSSQWNRWFPREFNRLGVEWVGINGASDTRDDIRVGQFLDVVETNYWKASQLTNICQLFRENKVKDGDVFFFADLWYPGLEMLAYMRDGTGIDFKITGYFHAGTYHTGDFLQQVGMERWGKDIELGWTKIIDRIYLGSQHHAYILQLKRAVPPTQVKIVGIPIDHTEIEQYRTKKIDPPLLVFPHRLTSEKRPEIFDRVCEELKRRKVRFEYIRTMEGTPTKEEYYRKLAVSTVSFSSAIEETFGIAMVESMILGTIPVVPNAYAYRETIPAQCRYDNIKQAIDMCQYFLTHTADSDYRWLEPYYTPYKYTIENIVSDLQEVFH